MRWQFFAVVVAAIAAFARPASAKLVRYQINCDLGKGTTQTRDVGGSTVTLRPSGAACDVSVSDPNGKSVFAFSATGMQVFVGTGITADGNSAAVIQADTVNPYRLFIVSLGTHPVVISTIQNRYGFWLQDDCGSGITIWTADGAFQQFPEMNDVYHNDLYVPDVVLRVRDHNVVDATPECRTYFDGEIKTLQSRLSPSEINEFRQNRVKSQFRRGEIKGYILKIVFCYLYTDRDKDAKQALMEMWPANDEERIWTTILKLRSEGVLGQLTGTGNER